MEIQSNLIRAAAECAAENNVRSYFNGVCIEYTASDDRVWIVGTNGQIFFAAWQAVDPVNESFKVLIPTKMASKIKSKSPIDVSPDGTVTTFFDGTAGSFKADTANQYPDWRYVVPKQVKNEHQVYQNIYLVKAAKIFDLVAGAKGKASHVDVRGDCLPLKHQHAFSEKEGTSASFHHTGKAQSDASRGSLAVLS